jgi:hypothetical protein
MTVRRRVANLNSSSVWRRLKTNLFTLVITFISGDHPLNFDMDCALVSIL